jgi:hypothetical protein
MVTVAADAQQLQIKEMVVYLWSYARQQTSSSWPITYVHTEAASCTRQSIDLHC